MSTKGSNNKRNTTTRNALIAIVRNTATMCM